VISVRFLPLLCACALLPGVLTHVHAQPSEVLKVDVPLQIDGLHALELYIYLREGSPHHGFAKVPERDNLPHRIDVTPSPAIEWQKADGTRFTPDKKALGKYSYKNAEFMKYRSQYESGEIKLVNPHSEPGLSLEDGKVSGFVDVLVLMPGESNSPGRGPANEAFRIEIDGSLKNGKLTGTAKWRRYAPGDPNFGFEADRESAAITGELMQDFWQPAEGTQFAEGKDWPQARGPRLNMSAIATDSELVDNLADARLLWVAEDIMPGGRSGAASLRGNFVMYPLAWQSIGYGGYGAPSVVDGRVYMQVIYPDEETPEHPEVKTSIYTKIGADPRGQATNHKLLHDAVFCFDARTGKQLWKWESESTYGNPPDGKSGKGMTACVYGDKVFARGPSGLYALDRKTGKQIWRSGPGAGGAHSHDDSPVIIGETLVLNQDGTLIGKDPDTGEDRWKHAQVIAPNALPTKVIIEGKEYLFSTTKKVEPSKRDKKKGAQPTPEFTYLIEPMSGEILWKNESLGSSGIFFLSWQDLIVGNGVRDLSGKKVSDQFRASGWKVSKSDSKKLWQSDKLTYPTGRSTPAALDGIGYIDTRKTGFFAIDMETGEVFGSHPHIYNVSSGSHNWTWHAVTNDRVITSGLLMFTTADKGFKLLPGQLGVDLASGYVCPIQPAIADGRIFLRLSDKLVCYDLRKQGSRKTNEGTYTATGAVIGKGGSDNDIEILIRQPESGDPTIAARKAELSGPERSKVASWIYESKHAQFRPAVAPGFKGKGDVKVRVGYQWEDWTLDVPGGTYTRRALPLPKPIEVKGTIGGKTIDMEDGSKLWSLYMNGAAGGGSLAEGKAGANMTIAVIVDGDGRVVRGWANAGRVNRAMHEVDTSKLSIEDNKLSGEAIVLFHDDPFFDIHYASAEAEKRQSGRGGLVAADYKVEANRQQDGNLQGNYHGTIGIPWQQSGELKEK